MNECASLTIDSTKWSYTISSIRGECSGEMQRPQFMIAKRFVIINEQLVTGLRTLQDLIRLNIEIMADKYDEDLENLVNKFKTNNILKGSVTED